MKRLLDIPCDEMQANCKEYLYDFFLSLMTNCSCSVKSSHFILKCTKYTLQHLQFESEVCVCLLSHMSLRTLNCKTIWIPVKQGCATVRG